MRLQSCSFYNNLLFDRTDSWFRSKRLATPEHSKVRAVSLQRDSSFYTGLGIRHYRDGVTNTEQNISQINWRPKRVKE